MKRYEVGHAGAGKTTRLANQLVAWLEAGVRPDRILVLTASRAAAKTFRAALAAAPPPGASAARQVRGEPTIGTFYSLTRNHVGVFFPLIAGPAGFGDVRREPIFLDIEVAQYLMARLVAPQLAAFADLNLPRPRLLGQLLDNAHKSALAGFPLDEIATRLGSAWAGDDARLKVYRRAQDMAGTFRAFCLAHNLLDFSLQHEVFARYLLPEAAYARFIADRYRHVLVDNVEEMPPIAHDFVARLLPTCEEAVLVEDDPGGYRLFLGADPASARALRAQCDGVETLARPDEQRPLAGFGQRLAGAVGATPVRRDTRDEALRDGRVTLLNPRGKYWVSMVRAVADAIIGEVERGTPPAEIAVVAPYVEDVLRFELEEALRERGIGVRAVRPSRPLIDHPVTRACVTFARLGYPSLAPAVSADVREHELARALSVAIDGLDLARAKVIADVSRQASSERLVPVSDPKMWERVGVRFRERVDAIAAWLEAARAVPADDDLPPLDVWWQLLFGQVLSQPGFGLAADREAANVVDKLVRSARLFREAVQDSGITARGQLPADYLALITEGVMAAQFVPEGARDVDDATSVLLAPVYTYLTGEHRSRVQLWLDVNATGWYDRLYQALTHPYTLTRHWGAVLARPGASATWTEADETLARQDMLRRVVIGLCDRCDGRLYLASSQLGLKGQEEAGELARALQRTL